MALARESSAGAIVERQKEEQKLKLRQALRLAGAGALTGALLLGTAPTATADDIRDRQWILGAFGAQDIWQHATGRGVVVAVVDSGVDASHPDLKGQVLKGKDFTEDGGSAQEDTDGHGTAMASLIAGQGHGPVGDAGVKGLAPDAKIMPIKFHHESGEMGVTWAEGVRYAVDNGADVINISQVTTRDTREKRAIEYAIENDVVVVAGTGNRGIEKRNYPAAYPGVVSVGGVDKSGAIWEDSSWGSNTTLMAPATQNVVADPTSASGYAVANGTSDATAYVSASAALVREAHPDLTAGQVIHRLIETAKIPTGVEANPQLPHEKFGYGIVRPFRAVTHDIPAGPKEGPLAQAEEGTSNTTGGTDDTDSAAADEPSETSEDNNGWMFVLGPPIILFGLIFVVLVGIVILVVVLAKKSKQKNQPPYGGAPGGPEGQGWGGPGVPPQYPGQQQPQAQAGPYGGPSAPPPPNQPPSR